MSIRIYDNKGSSIVVSSDAAGYLFSKGLLAYVAGNVIVSENNTLRDLRYIAEDYVRETDDRYESGEKVDWEWDEETMAIIRSASLAESQAERIALLE